ncbi:hypothetical protein FACS1894122_02460 [Alphaproteobacteria bacterium]|nr:hypothetical protein FACS1894122_02460 [Alphaproteobacteria bacterium]
MKKTIYVIKMAIFALSTVTVASLGAMEQDDNNLQLVEREKSSPPT